MIIKPSNLASSRRQFLARTVPVGALVCMGCKSLFAGLGQENKFSENPGITTEETYRFFYGTFIPTLQFLAKSIGRDKLVSELTKASAENYAQMMAAMAKDLPQKDMKAFARLLDGMMAGALSNKAFAYEVVEGSDKVYQMKFTQCLPAKLWREMDAADFGYALECSPVDAMAKAFNPKMKGAVLKTLMKGDSDCLVRFELA
jgi:hypothetical protein